MKNQQSATDLVEGLRGQQAHIPCLYAMFPDWPFAVNPNYKRMVEVVDQNLNDMVPSPSLRANFRNANFALFAATMFPRAPWLEYATLTSLILFFFLWDDAIEEGECSDFSAGQSSRKDTVKIVQHSLGFGSGDCPTAPNAVVESFKNIGDTLCELYTIDQRKLLLSELLASAKSSQIEQQMRIEGSIPTIAEYRKVRNGTIAVGPYLALGEFANQVSLPKRLLQSPMMKIVWQEACAIISIINDIVSLPKELAQEIPSPFSQIPLSCAAVSSDLTNVDVQVGVDMTMASLRTSIQNFDKAAASLLNNAAKEYPEAHFELWDYLDTIRENCTGTLYWSLTSTRYGIGNAMQEDGSLLFSL